MLGKLIKVTVIRTQYNVNIYFD